MGYRRSLESYLNLSRKELQGLCKKYSLPANRSHVQLAKSLASFFEKKNANAASLKETSRCHLKDSFHLSSGPESKHKETSYHPEATRKDVAGACKGRTEYSESDSYRVASNMMKTVGDDRNHPQAGNQLKVNSDMDHQTLKKAFDTSVEVVCPYPVNSENTKEFGGCISELGVIGIRPLIATDIQENTADPQLGLESHNSVTTNESQKSSPPRISGQKMLNHAPTNSGPSSLALFPCRPQIIIDCSTDNGFLSSYDISKREAPSLQFFAASEEGINLYVDLNSSPSEWINSLTDEVCIYQNSHQHNLKALSNHTRSLEDVDKHMKNSVSGIGIGIQSDGVERNTGCTNSSSSSVVNENCHSASYAPDAAAATSRSSLLAPSSIPVENPGCSEGNQVVSSSCITCFNVQNEITSNIASCLGDRMAMSKASVPDASLNSIGNMDVMSFNETNNPVPMDCHCLKTSVDCNNVEVSVSGNTLISISEKHILSMLDQVQNKKEATDIGSPEINSAACQVSVENGVMDETTKVAGHQNKPSNLCQIDGQLVLDCPATDAQSDLGSANHLLDQNVCSSLGNSVTEDPMSIFKDELGRSIAVKEIKLTEHSEFQNSLDRCYKRSHSSEFSEEFQSKRQHVNNVNKSGMMMGLRSTKTWGKETICDPVVLPRRSTRLVSK